MELNSGNLLWKHIIEDRVPTPNYVSSPALSLDKVLVVCGYSQQYLYCLDKRKGTSFWKRELDSASRFGFSSSPCIAGDVVYVVSAQGKVKAISIENGELVWEYDLHSQVLSSPVVSDDLLFIATLDGSLYALTSLY